MQKTATTRRIVDLFKIFKIVTYYSMSFLDK